MALGDLFLLLLDAAGLASKSTEPPKDPEALRRFRVMRTIGLFLAGLTLVLGAIAIFC